MGFYFNPSNEGFAKALRFEIYIDKTLMIGYLNSVIQTQQNYVCVSRRLLIQSMNLCFYFPML